MFKFKVESSSGDHSQEGVGLSKEEWEGSGQVPFLLAERARSEGARPMRAVKGSLGHSPIGRGGIFEEGWNVDAWWLPMLAQHAR